MPQCLCRVGINTLINMKSYLQCGILLVMVLPYIQSRGVSRNHFSNRIQCGPYGFVCDGISKLRLCEDGDLLGPSFRCPANTICNEESDEVCENAINYIDPAITRNIRCYRNERLADPSVPGCKGYIMCIPNKNRFQGLKFQCSGTTIFNGFTRACTSPDKYKCPLGNSTSSQNKYYSDSNGNRKGEINRGGAAISLYDRLHNPIECENYKFAVTTDNSPAHVTYFCPPRPAKGEFNIRCTVFSNNFCISLEKDED